MTIKQTITINNPDFVTYEDLIESYTQELYNFCGKCDNPLNRALLKSTHAKYLQLHQSYFKDNKGVEFEHLYVSGEDLLNDN